MPDGGPLGHVIARDRRQGWHITVAATNGFDSAVLASLFALSGGTVAARGELDGPSADRFILVSGAFGLGADGLVRPLPGPAWTVLDDDGEPDLAGASWDLDLRSGTVTRTSSGGGRQTLRFVSLARPGVLVFTAEDGCVERPWPAPLHEPMVHSGPTARYESGGGGDRYAWFETTSDRSTVSAVAEQTTSTDGDRRRLERVVAVSSGPGPCRDEAVVLLDHALPLGVDGLLDEHRRAWADRWDRADIEIDGDPASQLAVRFALFHLLSCAPTDGTPTGVGARGLTGLAYAGHVFWDTDVYVLPALAATVPDAARSVLRYRADRLGAARAAARERGLAGARYPWESADDGRDVTPTSARDLEGRVVPIRTGAHEDHIDADIAWALHHLARWTGEDDPLGGVGQQIVVETARYWRSRIRIGADGAAHVYGVIGPDEYHEVVDDNAYTNEMARWHLRWAATLLRDDGEPAEADGLDDFADRLISSFDPATGRHEQFAGYWDLEPLLIADLVEPPVAADILLGRERVMRTQVVKQPDVLMLHHLLPDQTPPGSLTADLDFYLPRTAHGSSLSPAVCASLLARAGRPDEAMALFDLASRIDLDDRSGTTAGGLHLATMGGLWQAVVFGFMGIRPDPEGLRVAPRLPARWSRCSVRLEHRGRPVRITATHDAVEVDGNIPVLIGERLRHGPVRTSIPLREEHDR